MSHVRCTTAALCLAAAALSLSGCALTETASPIAEQGAAIVGNVHGGQQPVAGAHVYLMQANTTGAGAASLSLLQSAVTGHSDSVGAYVLTGNDGSFSITNDYTCVPTTQVYLYALGGNPGSGTNSAAGFLAALGSCPAAGTFAATTPYIWVNEVSTVATAYAIAGYATDATHVSSSGTTLALTGIANAFTLATKLVGTATGIANTAIPGNSAALVPQTTINTLANILASCVNSNGPSSTYCSILFSEIKSGGPATGTAATDTATAAIYLAHYPANNTSLLYSTMASTVAFAPALSAAPNDFTLSISYTGGGINKPESVAIDASGNAWVANSNATGLTKILASGAFAPNSPFTGGGIGLAEAVAIDASGNAWVANTTNSTLSKFSSVGVALSPSNGYSGGSMNAPDALAVDANGYVWVGNSTKNACVSDFNPLTSTFVTLPSPVGPQGHISCSAVSSIAIDSSGDVWEANNDDSSVDELYGSSSGSAGSVINASGSGGIASPTSLALNSTQVWVANGAKNTTEVTAYLTSNFQTLPGPGGFTGGGVDVAYGAASDGSGNIWFANSVGSVSEFSKAETALSPASTGYGASTGFNLPYAIAVDGSGNLWIADEAGSTVFEMIGIATPVVTPIVAGLKTPYTPGSQP